MTKATAPLDLFAIDRLVGEEDRAIRDTVRKYVEAELKPELAELVRVRQPAGPRTRRGSWARSGVLGMHLEGYGCAGTSATAYGLACLELEAGDSGLRSLVSVQGSLAMFAIWRYGSEEQKQEWLPADGGRRGDRLLRAHRARLRLRPRRDAHPGAAATASDWVLDGTKMWITNGSIADVAVVWAARRDDGRIRGFVVPTDPPASRAPEIKRKMSLRASVTSELVLDGVRLPGLGAAAGGLRALGSAVVPQRGPVRDRLRRARRGPRLPRDDDRLRPGAARSSTARWRRSSSPRPSSPT